MPCYHKYDRAMRPIYSTIILFTPTCTSTTLRGFDFYSGLRKFCLFLQEWRFGLSRLSKIIDFDANRKRVCDFLFVRHRNLVHILHIFGDIAGFCAAGPPYLRLILGCSRCTRSPTLGWVDWKWRTGKCRTNSALCVRIIL